MMTPVDLVETPPLLCGQRSEYGMVQHEGCRTESPLDIVKRSIHGDQCIVKASQWVISDADSWHDLFWGLHARRETANTEYIEATETMAQASLVALYFA